MNEYTGLYSYPSITREMNDIVMKELSEHIEIRKNTLRGNMESIPENETVYTT